MLLHAEDAQGVPISVYDAKGNKHEDVIWCDTESGTIAAVYRFAIGRPFNQFINALPHREYTAPAPLRLVNMKSGVQITDELDLAVCAAFQRLRAEDERRWEALKRKQEDAFRFLSLSNPSGVLTLDATALGGQILTANRVNSINWRWVEPNPWKRLKPSANPIKRLTNALAPGKLLRWLLGRT